MKIPCECGAKIEATHLSRHVESKPHRAFTSCAEAKRKGHTKTVREMWCGTKAICAALAEGWPDYISAVFMYQPGFKNKPSEESTSYRVKGIDGSRIVNMMANPYPTSPEIIEQTLRLALGLNAIYGDHCAEIVVKLMLANKASELGPVLHANGLAQGAGYNAVYLALAQLGPYLLEAIREEP
jgi:hypothetical protein